MMAVASSPTVVLTSHNPRTTLHLSSSAMSKPRDTTAIQFSECYAGIGIKVIGGECDGVPHGIFIKRLLKVGQALADGRLRVGDQVVRVNGHSLERVTYSESLQILREAAASGQATFVISRDDKAQREFTALMDDELTTASEVSRSTTPLNTMDISRSSEDTLQSETSESNQASHHNSHFALMNNSNIQSGLTRTPSHSSANRQDIQRLANVLSQKLHGATAMASTPYNNTKESNEGGGAEATLRRQAAQHAQHAQQAQPDSLFAHQLYSSIHPGSRQSTLRRDGTIAPPPQPVNPEMRCSFEKLETALRFLGLNTTEAQKTRLRAALYVDNQGLISYGQFVQVVKRMFHDDLKHWDGMSTLSSQNAQPWPSHGQRAARMPSLNKSSTSMGFLSTRFAHDIYDECLSDYEEERVPAEVEGARNTDLMDEIKQLQKENFTLRKQIHALSKQLNEQTQFTSNAERDLHKFRAESQQALEETITLREKLTLATESQKMASQQEREFEKVVEGLEQQIKQLEENEAKQMESPTVRKKLVVMGSQLRKSEQSRRTYQVATQKLLDYCQYVHDAMSGNLPHTIPDSRLTPQQISAEALETMTLVRALLERDPLPFGWEECFDDEGSRYFINHVTEETSWQHPITRQGNPSNKKIY